MVVIIQNLAVEAEQAFARIYVPLRVDCLGTATSGACGASCAFGLAFEAEPAEGGGHRQRCTQRTQVLTERPFSEQRQAKQAGGKQGIGPATVEQSD